MRLKPCGLAMVTFMGGVRDRIIHGALIASLLLIVSMPVFTSFSMRDLTGVALTYALSVISLVGVLLTVIVGGNLIARDIHSRNIYSVATLPVSRSRYLLGKFCGFAMIVFCALAILAALGYIGVHFIAAGSPPDRPVSWINYLFCFFFEYEKLMLLAAVLILFSSIATSTFLPVILTLAAYAIGESTEMVKFFVETAKGGEQVSPLIKVIAKAAYYVFPNLSLFDLKTQVIYALPLDFKALLLTFVYGAGYTAVMLVLASIVFEKRDFA